MNSRIAFEVLCLFTIATAVLAASVPKKSIESTPDSSWNIVQKVYDDCSEKNDFVGCLKGKAMTALSRALDQVGTYNLPYSTNLYPMKFKNQIFQNLKISQNCELEFLAVEF